MGAGLSELNADFDEARFKVLNETMDLWTVDAADACQGIDQQLDLSAAMPKVVGDEKKNLRA